MGLGIYSAVYFQGGVCPSVVWEQVSRDWMRESGSQAALKHRELLPHLVLEKQTVIL